MSRTSSSEIWAADLSPFPYALIYPQDEHERLLIDRLAEAGVQVERQTELVAFEETAAGVRARLRHADGGTNTCEAAYLAGCDGAHSAVREGLRIGFPGGTYNHLFYVADVDARGAVMNGELHGALDTTDFLIVFPLKDDGRARLIGTVRTDAEHQHDELSWDDVSQRVIEWMRIDVERVNWFSTYRVHHRVADQFRKGRAFLLGDAAHIHSPVGGQGMNTGIGDAVNLAWKIADVVHGRADASLLDSYEPERIAFARRLVATTDQAFTGVTSDGAIARRVRLNIVPAVAPALFSFRAARRFMFRTISQTAVHYRGSSLSEGRAGGVHGGDRLPWVPAEPERSRQLHAADVARLAGPRVRRRHPRDRRRRVMNGNCRCTSFRGVQRWVGPACGAMRSISYGLTATSPWRMQRGAAQRLPLISVHGSSRRSPVVSSKRRPRHNTRHRGAQVFRPLFTSVPNAFSCARENGNVYRRF